jgi:DNA invertase Pin-like site-specific DNA recombinase
VQPERPTEVSDFYGRKSNKDDGRSVAGQEMDWREDCHKEGLTCGMVFADPDRSASRYARKGRPDYAALLTHIRSGNCQLVSLWESSRGDRKLTAWSELLDLCREKKVLIRVITHGRTYDVNVRRDWRTLADEGVDSADESEKISERALRGKRLAALSGRPHGNLQYGYRRVYDDRGHYVEQVLNETQAAIIRENAEKVAAGTPLFAVMQDLNRRGIPSPAGGKWGTRVIARMVTNPAYRALRVHRGEIVGAGRWPEILDEDTFNMCAALLSDPTRRRQWDIKLRWYLTGVAECSKCPGRLRADVQGRRGARSYTCAQCRKTIIDGAELDRFVEVMLLARLRQPDAASLFTPSSSTAELDEAKEHEKRLRAQLDAHYRNAAAEKLSPTGLTRMEGLLLPDIAAAAARIARLKAPAVLPELSGVDIPTAWPAMPVYTRRRVVQAASAIRVGPAVKGRGFFDPMRLSESRWRGDDLTWGQRWAEGD